MPCPRRSVQMRISEDGLETGVTDRIGSIRGMSASAAVPMVRMEAVVNAIFMDCPLGERIARRTSRMRGR